MAYQPVLKNEWGTVQYETTDHYIYHTIHKDLPPAELRTILDTGLDSLKANRAQKWLSDDRKYVTVTPEAIEFTLQSWGPRAAAAGWKYWAMVAPESAIGRAGMQEVVEIFYNLGVRMPIFSDLDEARAWLVQL